MQVPFKSLGPIIGLTGSLAAGKSTVSEYLRRQGIAVIDFETQVNLIRQQHEVEQALIQKFGTADARQIRLLIKRNPLDKMFLSSVVAIPALRKTMIDTNRLFEEGAQVVIWDSALLLETNSHVNLQGLILVTASETIRRARIKLKDPSFNDEQIQAVVDQQLPEDAKRAAVASYGKGLILENQGTLAELRQQLPMALDYIYSMARR